MTLIWKTCVLDATLYCPVIFNKKYIWEEGATTTTTISLVDRGGWESVIPAFQSLSLRARS